MADKRESHETDVEVPADVADFLQRLSAALRARDLDQLTTLYEVEMQQLTDRHYSVPHTAHRAQRVKMEHWPMAKFVKQHLGHPQVELLYQLLQYRSMYSDRNVSVMTRKYAWTTSEKAFDTFASKDVEVDLPDGWIWDMVDEYLYQLLTNRIKRVRADNPQQLPAGFWGVPEAMARLESVVEGSGIRALLNVAEDGKLTPAELLQRGSNHVKVVLGYSALVGIVKLRVLLGDYVGALQAAGELGVRTFGASISRCIPPLHVSLYYHTGFAYLMLGRFGDAVATLRQALTLKAANRKFVESMQTQVASLLLVAGTLGDLPPQEFAVPVVDRQRASQDDDAVLLAQGDVDRFREVFLKACPKFITAIDGAGDASGAGETGQEAKELQLRMFLRMVRQRVNVLKLRGYLSAYSTLTTQKVAALLGATAEETVAGHLVATKRGARQLLGHSWKRMGVTDFTAEGNSISVQRHFEQPTIAAALGDRVLSKRR